MPYCIAGVETLFGWMIRRTKGVSAHWEKTAPNNEAVIWYLRTENQSKDSRYSRVFLSISRAFSSDISRLFLKAAMVLHSLDVSGIRWDDGWYIDSGLKWGSNSKEILAVLSELFRENQEVDWW